jgi:hypothetical protein
MEGVHEFIEPRLHFSTGFEVLFPDHFGIYTSFNISQLSMWKQFHYTRRPRKLLGRVLFIIQICIPFAEYFNKKTRPTRGKTAPCDFMLRRKVFSHRSRNPPNPSPPLHRGLRSPCECRVSATHRYHSRAGPSLSLCFENEERQGGTSIEIKGSDWEMLQSEKYWYMI